MTWALAASAVVHAGIAAALVAGPAGMPWPQLRVDVPLRAEIAAPPVPLQPLATLQPARYKVPKFATLGALAATPNPVVAAPPDPTASGGSGDPLAELAITAAVLGDRNRLGPLLTRQLSEFPVEIDSPVHLGEPIVARLPASVVADSASEPIVVWAIVGWDGVADEVELASGDPSVAGPVLEAVRQARFVPARNGLVAHRYPIALEFRWAGGDVALQASEVAAMHADAAGAAVTGTSR